MPVGDVPETQAAAQEEERPERSVGGSAAIVSGATMCSRVLGLVRELLFAAIFGSTPFAAALKVGFLLPNLQVRANYTYQDSPPQQAEAQDDVLSLELHVFF